MYGKTLSTTAIVNQMGAELEQKGQLASSINNN